MRRDGTLPLAFADGARHLVLARRHRFEIHSLTIAPSRLSPGAHKLVRTYRSAGVPVATGDPPHAVRFSFEPRWHKLDRARGLWLAVENVQSPGNLGTMLRTAAAVGVAGVIFSGSADPWDTDVVRASMGAVFGLKLVRATPDHLNRWARRTRTRVVGTSASARRPYTDTRWRGPVVVMVGHERHGLSAAQRRTCQETVRIPMACEGSLNVATAAAVVLFEARRQRSRGQRQPMQTRCARSRSGWGRAGSRDRS